LSVRSAEVLTPSPRLPVTPSAAARAAIRSPWRDAWRRLLANRAAVAGMGLIGLFVGLAVLAPLIATHSPIEAQLQDRFKPPSAEHLFGTDNLGRDVFSRVLYGARISLWVGVFSVLLGLVSGSLIGLVSGYVGGWLDGLAMRLMDIVLAFPRTLLAIAIVATRGPGLENTMLAIGIVSIPIYARLARSMVLSLKERDYVLASRCLGASSPRLLFRHIFPNALSPLMVQGTLEIAVAIVEAAALGFLGLGAQPPEPEWGLMLTDARNFLLNAPWAMVFPGLAIMLSSLAFNLMGDGLRDALDPHLKE
jgi:peptide/nickel transport system permease protein